jgi:hypothetical protein
LDANSLQNGSVLDAIQQDGESPQTAATPAVAQKLTPEGLEACLRQLPKDSIEAEAAQDKREMQRWGWR